MNQNENKSNEKSLTALQPRDHSQYAGVLPSGVGQGHDSAEGILLYRMQLSESSV